MKTITEQSKIEIDYNSAENHEGAYATCRCLPGQYEQENMQEWAEDCTIDGAPAKIYYLFENAECESEDAEDYPWDSEHVSKIEIEEEDEDNEISTHTNEKIRYTRHEHKTRIALQEMQLNGYAQIIVSIGDSLAAGNCRSGTEQFCDRHFSGRTTATIEEILSVRSVMRGCAINACLRAIRSSKNLGEILKNIENQI